MSKRAIKRSLSNGSFALGVGLLASPALAFNYHELEVYPHQTEPAGIWEIENYTLFSNGDRPTYGSAIVRDTLEVNVGVTDSLEVALYNDFTRLSHNDMKYAATRLRGHMSFFDKGEQPVDLGAYFEVAIPHDDKVKWELEAKLILEKDIDRFTFTLNPLVEFEKESYTKVNADGTKEKEEEIEIEKGYNAAISYRFISSLLPKLAFFDQLADADERVAILMPSLEFKLFSQWKAAVGAGFGLSKASEKRLVSTKLEYEF